MSEGTLFDPITGIDGVRPVTAEALAMNVLLTRAVEHARESGEEGLADLGDDFLRHFDEVDVTLQEMALFKREYLNE